ncbi:MAG TPA: response regulator transcription factor [Nitriliruptoraceae bacterium]|nr:response regulator transcription factor [Nitriliruptoraceae bacterium]
MPARRLRVRIDGVQAEVAEVLASGRFDLVSERPADLHLTPAAGDGSGDGDGDRPAGRRGTGSRSRGPVPSDAGGRGRGYRPDRPGGALTPRERQVLERLGRGATNRQIGQSLYIADNTVKNHVRSILLKLDCRSRTEAVVTAHRLGLLEL